MSYYAKAHVQKSTLNREFVMATYVPSQGRPYPVSVHASNRMQAGRTLAACYADDAYRQLAFNATAYLSSGY